MPGGSARGSFRGRLVSPGPTSPFNQRQASLCHTGARRSKTAADINLTTLRRHHGHGSLTDKASLHSNEAVTEHSTIDPKDEPRSSRAVRTHELPGTSQEQPAGSIQTGHACMHAQMAPSKRISRQLDRSLGSWHAPCLRTGSSEMGAAQTMRRRRRAHLQCRSHPFALSVFLPFQGLLQPCTRAHRPEGPETSEKMSAVNSGPPLGDFGVHHLCCCEESHSPMLQHNPQRRVIGIMVKGFPVLRLRY